MMRADCRVEKFFKIEKGIGLFLCNKPNAMSDKDYQRLMDFFARQRERILAMTKEEALAYLQETGVLDKDGNFTKSCEIFGRVGFPNSI
jgi:hypothetical protein